MWEEGRTLFDKLGEPFSIKYCSIDDFHIVLEMYNAHMPEPVAQGLPPFNQKVRRKWISGLLNSASNFVALKEEIVIGHAALIPGERGNDSEYLIFVANPHRKRGLATVLTSRTIDHGRELGLDIIWLTVESDNFRAIKLYRKMGFEFCDRGLSERKMALKI
jgi:RimJ/RimL family protein N-acetyltransferase